jgi:hypothetical protein
MWRVSGRSSPQQEFKAMFSSTLQMMCAVFINVIFYSSVADGWPGSNWRFCSNPFLIVPIAAVITGTFFVFTYHFLLTLIFRCLVFLFVLCLCLSHLVWLYQLVGMSSLWYRAVLYQVGCLYCAVCDNRYIPHNSGTADIYFPFRCKFVVLISNL